jgi:DNA-binding protein H-NS
MINSFFKKLESTNYSNDKKIDILENIINKLDELIDKNQKIKQQIEYLIILLKRKIETFQNSS